MIRIVQIKNDYSGWDDYVNDNQMSNAYQISQWQRIINKTYGYKCYALAAVSMDKKQGEDSAFNNIKGLLPLVKMKSPIFGNRLISMPFFDHGGIIADNRVYEEKLIKESILLGKKLNAKYIELRHLNEIESLKKSNEIFDDYNFEVSSHKSRMLIALPETSDALMKSFKSKLRSQIKRPIKAGLFAKIGGMELIEDFYEVFSINMRDLGSPVHSKNLMESVLKEFKNLAKVIIVYKNQSPVASAIMIGFKETMINPWASSLRKHSKDSPNMLLYWSMLSYAADNGYKEFDFGRSTLNEGTFKFKSQWGALPKPMYWYTIKIKNKNMDTVDKEIKNNRKSREVIADLWSRLPVSISNRVGPIIRKHIDL